MSREEFEGLIEQGALLEYTQYVGNYYGTPIQPIEEHLSKGHDVFLEIEVQGAMKVRERMPEGIFIFLAPPNISELESRIVGRGTDKQDIIYERMQKAREEIEMMKHYDFVVVNDQVENAVQKINAIIQSEHLRVERMIDAIKLQIQSYFQKGE